MGTSASALSPTFFQFSSVDTPNSLLSTLVNFKQHITLLSTSDFGNTVLKHIFQPAPDQLKSPEFVSSLCQMKATLFFLDLSWLLWQYNHICLCAWANTCSQIYAVSEQSQPELWPFTAWLVQKAGTWILNVTVWINVCAFWPYIALLLYRLHFLLAKKQNKINIITAMHFRQQ